MICIRFRPVFTAFLTLMVIGIVFEAVTLAIPIQKESVGAGSGGGIGSSQIPTLKRSGDEFLKSALTSLKPHYPSMAIESRIDGSVVVEVTVDDDGQVLAAEAMSGPPLLKGAAVSAALGWKFRPALDSGRPARVSGILTFTFILGAQPAVNVTSDVPYKAEQELMEAAINKEEPRLAPQFISTIPTTVLIDERGQVVFANALTRVESLKRGAEDTALRWKFSPILVDGKPAKVAGTIQISFPTPANVAAASVDVRPIPLNNPRPSYTNAARDNKTEGTIRTRALVGADGQVKDVRIVRGLPDGLNEEAIKCVMKIRFKPAMKDGNPVDYWIALDVLFDLK